MDMHSRFLFRPVRLLFIGRLLFPSPRRLRAYYGPSSLPLALRYIAHPFHMIRKLIVPRVRAASVGPDGAVVWPPAHGTWCPARKSAWFAAKVVITLAILYVLVTGMDSRELLRALRQIRIGPWAAATCWMALASLLDALAARSIFGALGIRLAFVDVLRINYRAYFFSFLGALPGGISRWAGMAGPQKRGPEAFTGILLERFLRIAALVPVCLLGFCLQSASRFTSLEYRGYVLGLALLGAAILLVAILAFGHRRSRVPGAPGTSGQGAVARVTADLRVVWEELPRRRPSWLSAWATLVLRALASIPTLVLLMAALDVPVRTADALWVASMTNLAQVVPVSVCGLGVREGTLVYLLAKHGVSSEQGLLIGLLWFWAAAVLGVAGGVWFVAGRLRRVRMVDRRRLKR
ncbi:MAG: lysylphosphatidylglycerol synthase domain-containing protein [Kiritimatiellae bacterium]|nr:lysylphosphatidylglycerol synthase domain-containing protein [Kiritimatiellia bacterium]